MRNPCGNRYRIPCAWQSGPGSNSSSNVRHRLALRQRALCLPVSVAPPVCKLPQYASVCAGSNQRDADRRIIACNLDLKNPHALEAEDHRKPDEIVDAITAREREIMAIMDEIRAELAGGA